MRKDFFCLYSKGLLREGDIIVEYDIQVFEAKIDLRECIKTALEYVREEYVIVRLHVDDRFISLKYNLLRAGSAVRVVEIVPCVLEEERSKKLQKIFGKMKKV